MSQRLLILGFALSGGLLFTFLFVSRSFEAFLPKLLERAGCHDAEIARPEFHLRQLRLPRVVCQMESGARWFRIEAVDIILFYSWSGLRRGEIERLQIGTLNVERKKTEPQSSPKARITRVVGFSDWTSPLQAPLPSLNFPELKIKYLSFRDEAWETGQQINAEKLQLSLGAQEWKLKTRLQYVGDLLPQNQVSPSIASPKLSVSKSFSLDLDARFEIQDRALRRADFVIESETPIFVNVGLGDPFNLHLDSIQGNLQAGQIVANIQAKLENQMLFQADLRHTLGTIQAFTNFSLRTPSFSPLDLTAKKWLKFTQWNGDLHSGSIAIRGKVQWSEPTAKRPSWDIQAKGKLEAKEIGGYQGDIILSALNATADWQWRSSSPRLIARAHAVKLQQLKLEKLILNNFTSDINFELSRGGTKTEWSKARGEILGGTVEVPHFAYATGKRNTPAASEVRVRDIDFAEILKLKEHADLSATGKITATLPLTVYPHAITIANGEAHASTPGVLRYQPQPEAGAVTTGNPALEIAVQALSNFHYTKLASTVDFDERGLLKLGARLEGRNPDFQKGKVVHFNVNLEENLLALLKSLRIADDFGRTVDERVRRQQK